jgi:hypothetical protein
MEIAKVSKSKNTKGDSKKAIITKTKLKKIIKNNELQNLLDKYKIDNDDIKQLEKIYQ